jgi:hypothetical protein
LKFSSAIHLAAVPPLAVALFALLLTLRIPFVVDWFWPHASTNVAEAAALGDLARVKTLAAQGDRLDVAMPVDGRFRDGGTPSEMSAWEAAVRRRSDSLVEGMVQLRPAPAAAESQRLYCLARANDAENVAELLDRAFGPGLNCPAP